MNPDIHEFGYELKIFGESGFTCSVRLHMYEIGYASLTELFGASGSALSMIPNLVEPTRFSLRADL